MNIVDYLILVLLVLSALKGFRQGLLPALVNLVGTFLVFVIAFYLKQPISVLLYENLPFLNFAGIFKGIIAVNILFYEAIAYGLTIMLLGIVFSVIKRVSIGLQKILNITLFLNLPCKIVGGLIGVVEGILYCFILLFVAAVVNTTSTYVNDSKYGNLILTKTPIISSVASDLTNSTLEIYDVIVNNKNNTNKANLESVEILMKYDILSYESAKKLVDSKKLNIKNIDSVIEKYRGDMND